MIRRTSTKCYPSLLKVSFFNSDEHSVVNKQQPDICNQMLSINGCISCTHKILIIALFFFPPYGNGFGFVPIKPFRVQIFPLCTDAFIMFRLEFMVHLLREA